MIEWLSHDLRSAIRHARRRPGLTLAVTLTLGAAIGGVTTAVGFATAVLWRTLPFDDAQRLAFVWEEVEAEGGLRASRVTGSRYAAWRAVPGPFSSTALFGAAGFTLDMGSGATAVRGVRVSAGYFDTLGIRALIGRTFTASDETPGGDRVVVLSHGFWQNHFGGRRDILGTAVRLSGAPYVVIGVMPAGFPMSERPFVRSIPRSRSRARQRSRTFWRSS